jgi:hypothetical protein
MTPSLNRTGGAFAQDEAGCGGCQRKMQEMPKFKKRHEFKGLTGSGRPAGK